MTLEEAARVLTELADDYEKHELSENGWLETTYIPAHRMGAAALRCSQPDPVTGLVPCEYCTDYKSLYDDEYTVVEMLDDFIDVDVRIQYEGWRFRFYINYCPMCGRKLEVEG